MLDTIGTLLFCLLSPKSTTIYTMNSLITSLFEQDSFNEMFNALNNHLEIFQLRQTKTL